MNIDSLIIFFKILSVIMVTNDNANAQTNFVRKSTKECIKYIESKGLTFYDWDSSMSIDSGYGLVYNMPNGEIVLIPSSITQPYTGFIYKDAHAFYEMKKTGYYPIDEKYLTIWEIEKENLKTLPENVKYYSDFLLNGLKIDNFQLDLMNLEKAFYELSKNIANNKDDKLNEKLILSYAITIMHFMVQEKKAKWSFETRYQLYNSYKYPLLKIRNEIKDVVASVADDIKDSKTGFTSLLQYFEF